MKRATGLLLVKCLLATVIYAQAVAYDYSRLYETASPAVVQVTTDDGSGSGFLITPYGHIATNYHVIRNSRYLAVQFPDGRKVKASVAAVNPHYDMAILKVNSEVVQDIEPLTILAKEMESTIKVGIPVVAIGSPLNQKFLMTQGILSKVDETTLLGDFLLQAGNSGGPLMNREGEVIGINTFGESSLAGAIRVATLRDFLSTPELLAESMDMQPSPVQLRSVSAARYPVDVLNHKLQTEPLELDAYKFKAGDFMVTTITPVLIGKLQVLAERRRASNRQERRGQHISGPASHEIEEPYYEWHRSTESSLDYAVTFNIRPESGPTKRNISSRFIPPPLRFGKAGSTEMEFKGEFLEFRLYRDGEFVEPIMPGRQVIEGTSDQKNNHFVDQAYAGSYVYSPEEFVTGNLFKIQIIDARNPDQVHKEILFTSDSGLIRQLRADFTLVPNVLPTKVP
jgi:Trypsin-like peptidase domain